MSASRPTLSARSAGKLDYISGGASTSAYMAMNGTMPYRINLLRLGDIGLRGETDNFAPDFLG